MLSKRDSAGRQSLGQDIALAYIGALVPDESPFHNAAFSRAGNMYQENLLSGLKHAGLQPDIVLSQHPMPGFPRGRLHYPGRTVTLPSGQEVTLVGFVNVLPLRVLTVGLAVLVNLLKWAGQTRGMKRALYTYNLTEPSGLFTLLAARLIGAKALAAVVDINVPGNTVPDALPRRIDFWIQRRLLRRFDALTVVSDAIIRDFAPGARFIRVEGGVRESLLALFRGNVSSKPKDDETFTIVSAGSLDEANGVVELLDAFALLPDSRFRLAIAGAGPLQTLVERAARHDPRIEYCGFLSFAEVLNLYNRADVLVNMRLTRRLNTRYLFPSKLMEYLASGIPVITTATGHVQADYERFVFLVVNETAESLAGRIAEVAALDPHERRAVGTRAQEFVRQNLTWEAQGRRLAQFIRELFP